MEMTGWHAWYSDGGSYDSREYEWAAIPDDGVLAVIVRFGQGLGRIEHGRDWYWWMPGAEPFIAGSSDPRTEIEQRYPGAVLKRGKWASDASYGATVKEAMRMTRLEVV